MNIFLINFFNQKNSNKRLINLTFLILLINFFSCIKKFNPSFNQPNTGYLVVEGLINSGIGSTSLQLSRTNKLGDTAKILPELNATVYVEDSLGNHTYLIDTANKGVYFNSQLNLNHQFNYRLHIKTSSGDEYVSNYQKPLYSNPIDSVYWKKDAGGVNINLGAHSSVNGTDNYYISYVQTWEIVSPYKSYYVFNINNQTIIPRDSASIRQLDTCWMTLNSSNITVATTAGLTSNKPLNFTVTRIPITSRLLSYEYSILVNEYALTDQGYKFYQNLKKISEPNNGLFNLLPAMVAGNIHNQNNPQELVLGYVTISDLVTKRIFITNAQVSPWEYLPNCPIFNIEFSKFECYNTIPDYYQYLIVNFINYIQLPTPPCNVTSSVPFYSLASPSCIDCKYYGGTPNKPSFWVNK